jgi:hypothetical protein
MGERTAIEWCDATVENQEVVEARIAALLKIPATVRGVSIEPLLSPVDLSAFRLPPCNGSSSVAKVVPGGGVASWPGSATWSLRSSPPGWPCSSSSSKSTAGWKPIRPSGPRIYACRSFRNESFQSSVFSFQSGTDN